MARLGELSRYTPDPAEEFQEGNFRLGGLSEHREPEEPTWYGQIGEVPTAIAAGATESAALALRGIAAGQPTERFRSYLDQIEHGVQYRGRERAAVVPISDDQAYTDLLGRIADEPGMPQTQALYLRDALEKARRGDLSGVEFARSKLPGPVRERDLWRAGEAVSEFAREQFPATPGYEDTLGRKVGEGLGSFGAGLVTGIVPGVGAGISATFFTAMGMGEAADRAAQAGATDEQIIEAAGMGGGAGATDILPAEMLLGRLPGLNVVSQAIKRYGGQRVFQALGRIGNQAIVESAQEGGQQALQNLIAQQIHSPETQIAEGIVENMGIGGIVGGIAGLGREGVVAIGRRRSGSTRGDRARAVNNVPPPTAEDEASPIPTADIMEGRQQIADAEATQTANQNLDAAGLPQVGQPVRVSRGNTASEGVVNDAWGGDDPGVSVEGPDGPILDASIRELQAMGITLTGLPMPAERTDIEKGMADLRKDLAAAGQAEERAGAVTEKQSRIDRMLADLDRRLAEFEAQQAEEAAPPAVDPLYGTQPAPPRLDAEQAAEVARLTREGVDPQEAVRRAQMPAQQRVLGALDEETTTGFGRRVQDAPPTYGEPVVTPAETAQGFGDRPPPRPPSSFGQPVIDPGASATGFGDRPAPRPPTEFGQPVISTEGTQEGFGDTATDPRRGTGPRTRAEVVGPSGRPEPDAGPTARPRAGEEQRWLQQAIADATGSDINEARGLAEAVATATGRDVDQARGMAQDVYAASGRDMDRARALAMAISEATGQDVNQSRALAQSIAETTGRDIDERRALGRAAGELTGQDIDQRRALAQDIAGLTGQEFPMARAIAEDVATAAGGDIDQARALAQSLHEATGRDFDRTRALAQAVAEASGRDITQDRALAESIATATGQDITEARALALAVADLTGEDFNARRALAQAVEEASGTDITPRRAFAEAVAAATGKDIDQARGLAQAVAQATGRDVDARRALAQAIAESSGRDIDERRGLAEAVATATGRDVNETRAFAESVAALTGRDIDQRRGLAQAIADASGTEITQRRALAEAIATNTGADMNEARALAQWVARTTGRDVDMRRALAGAVMSMTGRDVDQRRAEARAFAALPRTPTIDELTQAAIDSGIPPMTAETVAEQVHDDVRPGPGVPRDVTPTPDMIAAAVERTGLPRDISQRITGRVAEEIEPPDIALGTPAGERAPPPPAGAAAPLASAPGQAERAEGEGTVSPRAAPPPPLMRSNGEPYKTEKSAALAARTRGLEAEPVEVEGGWALQQAMPAAPVEGQEPAETGTQRPLPATGATQERQIEAAQLQRELMHRTRRDFPADRIEPGPDGMIHLSERELEDIQLLDIKAPNRLDYISAIDTDEMIEVEDQGRWRPDAFAAELQRRGILTEEEAQEVSDAQHGEADEAVYEAADETVGALLREGLERRVQRGTATDEEHNTLSAISEGSPWTDVFTGALGVADFGSAANQLVKRGLATDGQIEDSLRDAGIPLGGGFGVQDIEDAVGVVAGDRQAQEILFSALESRGIKAVRYRNAVEGGEGYSVAVIDPTILTPAHRNELVKLRREDQTQTPEFQRWFGRSQVTTPEGEPQVVYHGGRFDEQADGVPGIPHAGMFFTPDREVAESYAGGGRGQTTAAYLSLQNPFRPSEPSHVNTPWVQEWIDFWRQEDGWVDRATGEAMSDGEVMQAIEDGRLPEYDATYNNARWHDFLATVREHHDGYIGVDPTDQVGPRPPEIMVAFSPEQVKSTENVGAFDPASPDVRMRREEAARRLPEPGAGRVRIRVARRFEQGRERVRSDLNRIGRETFGQNFNAELAESITTPEGDAAPAAYDPQARIAYIAMRADQEGMKASLMHEGVHYLRGAGVFSRQDGTPTAAWRTLENEARTRWREQYNIDQRYGETPGLTDAQREDLMNEEAVAEAAADFATRGRETGFGATVRMGLNRILRFFRGVAQGLRSRGFRTAESIMEGDILSGAAGRRADATRRATPAEMDRYMQTAWHGSPHRFDAFSTAAIGTGEGAQVYGHGLYFTDTKQVADHYRNMLATGEEVAFNALSDEQNAAIGGVDRQLIAKGGEQQRQATETAWRQYLTLPNLTADERASGEARLEAVEALKGNVGAVRGRAGATYRVNLAPQEDEYLLWDEPLSKQSPKVREALSGIEDTLGRFFGKGEPQGRDIYDRLSSNLYEGEPLRSDAPAGWAGIEGTMDQRAASKMLAGIGIRGIKYRDQMTRGKEGEGSYNYVIFDDRDVRIEEILLQRFQQQPQPPIPPKPGKKPSVITAPARAWEKQGQKVLDQIHKRGGYKFDPLGNMPGKNLYKEARYRTFGRITEVENIAGQLFKTFRRAPKKERELVYEYLTTKDADPAMIPTEPVREAAIEAKQMIDDVGRNLVDRGLLQKETWEANRGEYLPRVYLKYLLDEAPGKREPGRGVSDLGYLKKRKDIPKEVRQLILGEITDPGFLASKAYGQASRDMAILDFMETISKNEDWIFPKSLVQWGQHKVTPQFIKAEAARLRRQSQFMEEGLRPRVLDIAQKMDATVDPLLEQIGKAPKDFKQVPDTARYGLLRGMMVRKEIYADLIGASQMLPPDASLAESILGTGGTVAKMTALWKLSKVALNPPTQIRNFISNAILLNLSGVPMHLVPVRMVQAMNSMATDDQYWKVAKKYGVTGNTTFANVELMRFRKELLDIKTDHTINPLVHLMRMGTIIGNAAGDVFQLTEGMYKTARIIDSMKREGKGEAQAALDAHEALFDYSLVPTSVRYLRSAPVGMPFASFYYFAFGKMLQVAIKNPLRLAPYIALPYVMASLMAEQYDVDEEDVEKLKTALPFWIKDKGHAYFLPYKDELGRWQAVDISYFIPWAMFEGIGRKLGKGEIGEAVMDTGLLGGPLPDVIAAVKTNIDPFKKQEIMDISDPPEKQVADLMQYTWRMAAPSWLTDIGVAGHAYRTITGAVNPRTGDPLLTPSQVAGRMFGVNIYPIDPEESRERNIRAMHFDIKDIERRRNRRLKNKNLSDEDRRAIRKRYNELIRHRRKEIERYKEASEVHPNLRQGQ